MQKRDNRSDISNGTVQIQRQADMTQKNEYSILNISRGGLCFQSPDEFELNEVVELDIRLNSSSPLSVHARICYRNELSAPGISNYGLSFLDKFIDPDLIRDH